ncbi:MAG: OmpA family protein [Chitinophagaceae bacterium]
MNIILTIPKNRIHSFQQACIAKIIATRFVLLMIGCTLIIPAQGQSDNSLALADKYFAAGDYFTAAGLYEQYLHPSVKQMSATGFPLNSKKNRTSGSGKPMDKYDILYKQAESYRMANYWQEASEKYKECFEKNPAKYSAAIYWYAVCQRSLGNNPGAEENIKRFLDTYASGNTYQQAAEKELQTIQFIKTQLARPDSILYQFQKINASFSKEKGVYAPSSTGGNQMLITSTQADPVITTGINPFHSRLFYTTLTNGNLENINPVLIEDIDSSLNQGAASISANGEYLYFTQWKKEKGQSVSSIYYSTKKNNGWGKPIFLTSINSEVYNSKQPFCSAEGKYLFFASDRPGGYGNFDIWFATIRSDGTTGEPVNAGEIMNTTANEQAPFYHSTSHSMVFASDRKPGMGGFDLFTSKGWETKWGVPDNMGNPVNSSRDDLYFFAAEKRALLSKAIISSDRGSECCLETYTVSKSAKKKMITGVIHDCKDNEPVANTEVVMKDGAGKSTRAITGNDGNYKFELTSDVDLHELNITKELYKDKTAGVAIVSIDESDWLTDILMNETICIEKKLVIKVENVVTLYFDFDKSELKPRGIAQLDSIYTVLAQDSIATIQISGYTDGRGTVEYNKVLSDKRAKACADYLVQKGIDSTRITFESFGACCPVEMELLNGRDNESGRSKNRRALINIKKD